MNFANVKQPSKLLCKCHYCCLTPILNSQNSLDHQNSSNITHSSNFQYDFATSTISSLYSHTQFSNHESLPTLQQSLRSFNSSFPQYLNTVEIDQIRAMDFPNLSKPPNVCLDYIGHALFSFTQVQKIGFNVSKLETRIMKYLNVVQDDYSMYFTTNQASAFRVVAESYPYKTNKSLISVYDHENEAIEAMINISKNNGARISTAEFKWPKLKIHSKKLEEMLVGNGGKRVNKGLFVFPIQSRISGARYSYQWMNLAREYGWHVLLDATSLAPKDMDTLGLSLFQPDFLVCTFYKVFGDDPSGFSCLLVKKSDRVVLNLDYLSSARGKVNLIDPSRVFGNIEEKISGQVSGNCYSEKGDAEKSNSLVLDQEYLLSARGKVNLVDPSRVCGNFKGKFQLSENCYSEKGNVEKSNRLAMNQEYLSSRGKVDSFDPSRECENLEDKKSSGNNYSGKGNVEKSNPLELDQEYLSSSRGSVTLVIDSDEENLGQQREIDYFENKGTEEIKECDIECIPNLDPQISGHPSGNCCSQKDNAEIKGLDIEFKALDHADLLGLGIIGIRTRCLVNWLANALLALNHPQADKNVQLIQVYGPKVRFNRGPALAFNIFDWKGDKVDPLLVQKLADRYNISLGNGCLKNVWFSERYEDERNQVLDTKNKEKMRKCKGKAKEKAKNEIVVITISLSFLTNFEDVYRVWEFVAKFLDADFVEKERWRYIALNQKLVHL